MTPGEHAGQQAPRERPCQPLHEPAAWEGVFDPIDEQALLAANRLHAMRVLPRREGAGQLLVDELRPLVNLGKEESKAAIQLLARLKSELTMVLVEHDMDAVFALATRVSVLVYGRIIATGSPAEIKANAQVRAAYLGTEEGA